MCYTYTFKKHNESRILTVDFKVLLGLVQQAYRDQVTMQHEDLKCAHPRSCGRPGLTTDSNHRHRKLIAKSAQRSNLLWEAWC